MEPKAAQRAIAKGNLSLATFARVHQEPTRLFELANEGRCVAIT
jgi:hypothetical protein